MARVAKVIQFLKKALALPEDLTFVTIKRTIYTAKPENASKDWTRGSQSNTLLKVLNCERNAAGVRAMVAHLSAIMAGDGDQGPIWVADAINNTLATQAAGAVTVGNEDQSSLFIPFISPLSTVDPSEIVAARLGDWNRANPGKIPSQEVLTAMYAGVV